MTQTSGDEPTNRPYAPPSADAPSVPARPSDSGARPTEPAVSPPVSHTPALAARTDGESARFETGPWLLLAATLCTTFYAGLVQSEGYATYRQAAGFFGFSMEHALQPWFEYARIVLQASAFSACLLGILFAHEMGHYLTARKLGVRVSFPVFLPSVPPFGTLGAFIRMESRTMSADSLMRVAVWGPYAGMLVAVPVLVVGLLMSDIRPLPVDSGAVTTLGSCLLMRGLELTIAGPVGPGTDLFLHPVAFAGWAGCFVTSLNLLPLGQLDGGHVIYALFGGARAKLIARVGFVLLILGSWFYLGWLFFGGLIYFVLGIEHPPMTTTARATGVQRGLGWGALALFVATFAPIPIGGGGLRDLLPELGFWFQLHFG